MVRILVIDDSKAVHSYIKECLKNCDVALTHAMNGEEGVTKIRDANGTYDLIILDWEMPVLNGPDAVDKLKTLGLSPKITMLTSKNDPKDIERMLAAGVAEYMMKPFTADILIAKIEELTETSIQKGGQNVAA